MTGKDCERRGNPTTTTVDGLESTECAGSEGHLALLDTIPGVWRREEGSSHLNWGDTWEDTLGGMSSLVPF